eukprot:m.382924 g.382924  ORF g.382924 m.382924 type:complete len:50 (-) comp120158_c0_seq1:25-174(-)
MCTLLTWYIRVPEFPSLLLQNGRTQCKAQISWFGFSFMVLLRAVPLFAV